MNNGKSSRFGYGWLISEVQGSPSFDHGGAISGFTSEALYLPEEEVYIAILTNCICYSPEEALIKMAALSIGKPYIMKELSLNAEKANEYAGIYENENGERISIKINGNKLIWQRGDGNPDRIIPFSYDKFYLESKDLLTIHFSRDESADVYGLQFRSRLKISDWKKIQ